MKPLYGKVGWGRGLGPGLKRESLDGDSSIASWVAVRDGPLVTRQTNATENITFPTLLNSVNLRSFSTVSDHNSLC